MLVSKPDKEMLVTKPNILMMMLVSKPEILVINSNALMMMMMMVSKQTLKRDVGEQAQNPDDGEQAQTLQGDDGEQAQDPANVNLNPKKKCWRANTKH